MNKEIIIKCSQCDKKAVKVISYDIDLPEIPLCNDVKCRIQLYIKTTN